MTGISCDLLTPDIGGKGYQDVLEDRLTTDA